MSNSAGNTGRDVRRFLREHGVKPTAANVDRIGREIRRSAAENERVNRAANESGRGGARDHKGPVDERVRAKVLREIERRDRQ